MKNDGGAAFPTITEGSECGIKYLNYIPGMTLRDWFAGQAMKSLIEKIPIVSYGTNDFENMSEVISEEKRKKLMDMVAIGAYLYADAMIAERENE